MDLERATIRRHAPEGASRLSPSLLSEAPHDAANHGNTSPRTGTLTIGGLTFTVNQAGCSYGLRSTSRTVGVGGTQSGTVNVNASNGCGWTAVSNAAWITMTSGQSGSGGGRVRYSVASNQGTLGPRTGTLTIAGRTFTEHQLGGQTTPSPGPGGSGRK